MSSSIEREPFDGVSLQPEKQEEVFPKIITDSKEPFLKENAVSMLSNPNRVKAVVPNFDLPDMEIAKLGLQNEGGQWFVPNRRDYPDPITEDSILLDYGEKQVVSPQGEITLVPDLGFCSKEKFKQIYVDSNLYEGGEIRYIDPNLLPKGEFVEAVKCGTGSFLILPEGTEIKSNEGNVNVLSNQVVVIDEFENSVYRIDISEVLERYRADSMNISSGEAFDLMQKFWEKAKNDPENMSMLHKELVSDYYRINRNIKSYEAFETVKAETLKEHYKQAAKVVAKIEKEMSEKINALSFEERLSQGRIVLREILEDGALTKQQKEVKVSYIKARLLPKTNNHQHLRGSVPKEIILSLAGKNGFSGEEIAKIEEAYVKGSEGFDDLDEFNKAYAIITSPVRTQEDYRNAVKGIIRKATEDGQITVEIRSSIIGQRENSVIVDPKIAGENILQAMDEAVAEVYTETNAQEKPKLGFVILGYRGKDGNPVEVIEHAKLATYFAEKYPFRKFGFDIAGPEDTGYNLESFKEAFDIIQDYNKKIEIGQLKGEKIGITCHAGETPTYRKTEEGVEIDALRDDAIKEAIRLGVDRIGHGLSLDPETMRLLKEHNVNVEICGVCNILSIPKNTQGMAHHPVEALFANGISTSICTDNCGVCGTGITQEYAQFLLTGHKEFMNWNNIKKISKQGIENSFIPAIAKEDALKIFIDRVRKIERMLANVGIEVSRNNKQYLEDNLNNMNVA